MLERVLAYIIIAILIPLIIFLSFYFIIPWFFGAPYEGTKMKVIKEMIKLGKINKNTKAIELGSGDGRIVIEFAKAGAKIDGYEINPFLVWISRRKIKKAGLQNNAKIYLQNFWNINLSKYNTIVLFQFKTITNSLSKKFKAELKKGSKIISHYWKIPNFKLETEKDKIYIYKA